MAYDAGLKVGIDGEAGFKKSIKTINGEIRELGRELRATTLEFYDNGDSVEALTAKNKVLEKEIELHKAKVELLSKEYEDQTDELEKLGKKLEETKEAHGEDSEEVKKAQKEYDTQASKVRKLESELGAATSTLNRYTNDVKTNTDSIKNQSGEAGKLEKELNDLKAEMGLLESDQKKLTSSFKLQAAQMGDNATEAEKLEMSQRQLKEQMELTEKVVKNLENQLDRAKATFGENSKEVKDFETKINNAKTEVIQFKNKLDDLGDGAGEAGDGLDELSQNVENIALIEVADAVQGLTDKLIELGQVAFDTAMLFSDSVVVLKARLGITADEAEVLNEVVKEVFENGVVGSVQEAVDAVVLAKQSFGDLNEVDLTKVVNQIITIGARQGTDVNENIIAAEKLMERFGLTGTEALDLISAGYQSGLDKNNDFLDVLNEYSPHFEEAGFSASEMLQILSNGMENGSMNTDKAADAVKEFKNKLADGSIENVIGNFSDETQNMFQKWKNGEATVGDVAKAVSEDIKKMTPTEQQEALSLISSQFEDLGIDATAALFNVGDGFTDVTGKAEEMSKQTPGEEWEGSLRKLKDALIPIGETLKETFSPLLEELTKIVEAIGATPEPIQKAIGGILITLGGLITAIPIAAIFVASFNTLAPILAGIAGSAGGLGGAIAALTGPIGIVIAAVAGIVAVLKGAWDNSEVFRTSVTNAFETIKTSVNDSLNKIKEAFAPVIETFKSFGETTGPVLKQIGDFIGEKIIPKLVEFGTMMIDVFTKIIVAMAPVFSAIGNLFSVISNLVGMVYAIFTGDWSQAWEFAKNAVVSMVEFIGNMLHGLINVLLLIFESIKNNMQQKWQEIHDNVSNIVTTIRNFISSAWQAIFENTSEKWEEIKQGIIDKVKSLPETLKGFAEEMLNKIAEGIRNTAENAWNAMTEFANDLKEKFKEALGIHSPSTEFFGYGKNIVQGLIDGLNIDSVLGWVNDLVDQIKSAFSNGNFSLQAAIEFIGTGAAEFFQSIGIGGSKFGNLTQPVSGPITSGFGYRPPEETNGVGSTDHEGIDIGAAWGTPVGAAGSGTVDYAGWLGGYGNAVIIDHGSGLETLYGHLSQILVSVGQLVSQLQMIGLVGSTGNSTGPHLHFGVYQDGVPVDPSSIFGFDIGSRYIPQDMVAIVHEGEMIVPKSENPYANSGGEVLPGASSNGSKQPVIIQVTLDKKVLSETLLDSLDDLIGGKTGRKARGMA